MSSSFSFDMNNSTIIILSVIAFFLVILLILRLRRKDYDTRIKYYYSPGCPHCRHFMPVWEEFSSTSKNNAKFEKINCSETPELCSDITGVPHITFSDKEKFNIYRGDRTTKDLKTYLESFNKSK